MTNEPERIQVVYYGPVSNDVLRDIEDGLKELSPLVSVRQITPGPYNAVDLSLPALIAVFFGAQVTAGFLGEIGADLYRAVKPLAVNAVLSAREATTSWVRSNRAIQPPAFSLDFHLLPHQRARFVFPPSLSEIEVDLAAQKLPSAVAGARAVEEAFLKAHGGSFIGGRHIDYFFDSQRGDWVQLTVDELMKRRRDRGT